MYDYPPLFCLYQLPGDYSGLRETDTYKTQWGEFIFGLCFCNHRLFIVEGRSEKERLDPLCRLCMYSVTSQGITLLDTVLLEKIGLFPRVNDHTRQVYVVSGVGQGISVFSWEDNRLTPQPSLTCVGKCCSVGVLGPQLLCVCEQGSGKVNIIRATDDTVTDTLRKPTEVGDKGPVLTAVLGKAILVRYSDIRESRLVIYENGVTSNGTTVTIPERRMMQVGGMSSDGVSRFLVCDPENKAVLIRDVSGTLCDNINIDTDSVVGDCTVGDGKLWVGCCNGDIVVMSPQ